MSAMAGSASFVGFGRHFLDYVSYNLHSIIVSAITDISNNVSQRLHAVADYLRGARATAKPTGAAR